MSNNKLVVFSALLRKKKELMFCIFLTLIFQLVVTTITMKLDYKHQLLEKQSIIVIIIGIIITFVLIYLMVSTKLPFIVKQLVFVLFSIIWGLLLSQGIHAIKDPKIIEGAALATLINTLLMLIVGFVIVYMGVDLGWMGIYLMMGLFVLITISFIRVFTPESPMVNKVVSCVSIILFSMFILYDTNNILLKYNGKDDCIRGGLDYYLDIFNLFTNYLNLENN